MNDIEAVILTGGGSRRMGMDKSKLLLNGEAMLDRMLRLLDEVRISTTVLGPDGLPDSSPGSGPLCALAGFRPTKSFVFVTSCDIPRFDPSVVTLMRDQIGDSDACIPVYEQRLQPLCALYSSKAFGLLPDLIQQGEIKVSGWTDRLNVETFEITKTVDPRAIRGANTPEEWADLVSDLV